MKRDNNSKSVANIKTVFSVAVTVLLIGLIILLLFTAIGNRVSVGSYRLVVVISSSMDPALQKGSLILVKDVPEDDLAVGDIVTFHPTSSSDVLVTHRITSIDREEGLVTTMGDNNNVNDSPVTYANIVGKVIFSVPLVGYILDFLKTPSGIAIFLASIVLFEVLLKIYRKRGEKANDKSI